MRSTDSHYQKKQSSQNQRILLATGFFCGGLLLMGSHAENSEPIVSYSLSQSSSRSAEAPDEDKIQEEIQFELRQAAERREFFAKQRQEALRKFGAGNEVSEQAQYRFERAREEIKDLTEKKKEAESAL